MEERTYAKECGLRCSRLRMAQGMSQQELAEKVFTTAQNISKYEKNGISNIDMIRRISDALGHDLLVDETDAEGVVGEIGKEILWKLIEAGGYKPVTVLAGEDMFGMSMSRINQEIFKLEHIGMCVREQYVDFDKSSQDMLFVTAKGLITYKSLIGRSILNDAENKAVNGALSYERLLDGAESYQAFVNNAEAESLIRSIDGSKCDDYRVNYIHYLKTHFEKGVAEDNKRIDPYCENLIPEQGFYSDLIYRMAMHYDRDTYLGLLTGANAEESYDPEMDTLEDEYYGLAADPVIFKTNKFFENTFPIINERACTGEGLCECEYTEEDIQNENMLLEYMEINDAIELHYKDPQEIFRKSLDEGRQSPYPTRWFSDEEIREFIVENIKPAETDTEMELDAILKQINGLEPRTLDYYQFPSAWELNGLADLVREIYKLPKQSSNNS